MPRLELDERQDERRLNGGLGGSVDSRSGGDSRHPPLARLALAPPPPGPAAAMMRRWRRRRQRLQPVSVTPATQRLNDGARRLSPPPTVTRFIGRQLATMTDNDLILVNLIYISDYVILNHMIISQNLSRSLSLIKLIISSLNFIP